MNCQDNMTYFNKNMILYKANVFCDFVRSNNYKFERTLFNKRINEWINFILFKKVKVRFCITLNVVTVIDGLNKLLGDGLVKPI